MWGFRPRRQFGHRHHGGDEYFRLLLGADLARRIAALPWKPMVTLGWMALLTAIHMAPYMFYGIFSFNLESSAFVPWLILDYGEYQRLWAWHLVHASDHHLYYNLVSFLYKGLKLERELGSENFFTLIGVSMLLTSAVFMALSVGLASLGFDTMETRTVGFSGVVFCLKVCVQHVDKLHNQVDEVGAGDGGFARDLNLRHLLGLDLPWDKIVWVELIFASLVSPSSSFLAHLSGILAGLILVFATIMVSHTPVIERVVRPSEPTRRSETNPGGRADASPIPEAVYVNEDDEPPGSVRRPAPSPPVEVDEEPYARRPAPQIPETTTPLTMDQIREARNRKYGAGATKS